MSKFLQRLEQLYPRQRDTFPGAIASGTRHAGLLHSFLLLMAMVSAGFFYWLSIAVLSGRTLGLDQTVLQYLHGYRHAWLDRASLGMSMLVTTISIVVLCHFMYRRLWHSTLVWFSATAGAALLAGVIKKLMHRHRPDLWAAAYPQSSFGFPSGHATESAAIVLTLLLFFAPSKSRPVLIAASAVFISVVGLCRMYLGLHYPTDILGGWALAAVWVCTLGLLFHPLNRGMSREGMPTTYFLSDIQ